MTFDTGALIALERKRQNVARAFARARLRGESITVPAVIIAEWWRGRTDARERILAAVEVEHTDIDLLKLAGEAQAAIVGATCIDAMVMASAARRGDVVYTSDFDDLDRLRGFFPNVKLFLT